MAYYELVIVFMFITFEGCDGSGKTSQAKLLQIFLSSHGIDVVLTKEPGGTELANKIRSLLLENEIKDAKTEFALLTAARRDHVVNFIYPHLEAGAIVICDRFFDSSLVYQGIVKGLDLDDMIKINRLLVGDIKPDLTFLLDMPVEENIKRLMANDRIVNHYDAKPADFCDKIRKGFLLIAQQYNDRFCILNASLTLEEIALAVQNILVKRINLAK